MVTWLKAMTKRKEDRMPREEVEALIATYKKCKDVPEIHLWKTINEEMKAKGFRVREKSMNLYKHKWISLVKYYEEKRREEGITHWKFKAMEDALKDAFVPFQPESESQNSENY